MNEEETRKHARYQVETFLEILQDRYGLSDQDVIQLAGDLIGLHERAQFARRLGEWTAKSVIVVLVTAFFSGMAWAIVHFIEAHSR